MARYKELKYNGETITEKYKIDEILLDNGFNWFLDAEVENMRLEIMKETLIINAGIWYNGVWEYGVLRDVDWRSGTFMNGVIYNGVFKKITVEKGIIFNGKFLKGNVLKADVRGGEFMDVTIARDCVIEKGVKRTGSEIQMDIPQTQTQQYENFKIKKIKDFLK